MHCRSISTLTEPTGSEPENPGIPKNWERSFLYAAIVFPDKTRTPSRYTRNSDTHEPSGGDCRAVPPTISPSAISYESSSAEAPGISSSVSEWR